MAGLISAGGLGRENLHSLGRNLQLVNAAVRRRTAAVADGKNAPVRPEGLPVGVGQRAVCPELGHAVVLDANIADSRAAHAGQSAD